MNNSILLIHISAAQSQAVIEFLDQPDSLRQISPGADVTHLIDVFCRKLSGFTHVCICVENALLRDALLRYITAAKIMEWQAEIAAVRVLMSDKSLTHIAIANGIYPLLDLHVTRKLFDIHTEYRADITYAENLPPGMALNYLSRDLLESLDIMEAKDDDLITGIRPFVEKNINQFHAEVHYEEPDMRLLRLDFSLASKRSVVKTAAFLKKLHELADDKGTENPYAKLQAIIQACPELLHVFPSYIEVEFSATSEAKNFFSPLSVIDRPAAQLDRGYLGKIRDYIALGPGDTSVSASGLGEPLEHPAAIEFLAELLSDQNIRYVFLETNGLQLDKLESLIAHESITKLRIIVMLNSLERYSEFSGTPQSSLGAVKNNVRNLTSALAASGKNAAEIVYLQALKVEENESEIDALYALAEELGASFLFQKYNRYAGLLPERRVSDMTPLERYSCWHLRRDLFIRANGDVAFCKQTVDPKKPTARGNLSKDTLADIWAAQRADFVLNFQGKYPAHLPCAHCDEYFTFNY